MKLFKRILFTLLTVTGFAVAFTSCGKIPVPAVNVPLSANGITFIIPAAPAGDTSTTFYYTVNLDSLVKQNSSLQGNNITSVKIDSIIINAPGATSGNDFNNVASASVDFKSNFDTTATTIAMITNADNSPAVDSTLKIPVNSTINLSPYITTNDADSYFTFTLHSNLRRSLEEGLSSSATVYFVVQASL